MTHSLQERVGVTEVQIDHLSEKIDDLKQDVQDLKVDIHSRLTEMQEASTQQHGQLSKKITEIQQFRDRWVNYVVATFVVLTWIAANLDKILHYITG